VQAAIENLLSHRIREQTPAAGGKRTHAHRNTTPSPFNRQTAKQPSTAGSMLAKINRTLR